MTGVALAECHGSGETWGNYVPSVQSSLRDRLCKPGQLAGHFNGGQRKSTCVQLGNGIHANFEVRRKGGVAGLSNGDCYFYFNREVSGCRQGGHRDYENWYFRYVNLQELWLILTKW